ncbi:MAG: aminomethyl-transferring glycine dehydrogenase subunit GcvPB, partial [candidate division Zixibacteria bacterium]|nr:aminomethyl-transferring glycine dehydrogenase subunit GcvPB [candidate division Zixibacteria bacterium]
MEEKILIYEKSMAGRRGYSLPQTTRRETEILSAIPEKFRRREDAALPEMAEPEVVRHFVRLSIKNHHIDKGFYPLGSCTMKYNPKLNDVAASLPGFQSHHPLTPCSRSAGSLQLAWELMGFLKEVSGFSAISLQPVAGAHGEFCGLLIMRAYHADRGRKRHKIIIPDSAHGTNPASVTSIGFTVVGIKSNERGIISPDAVAAVLDDDVAGIMMTNPNTLGLFESNIEEISRLVHKAGGLLYMD